jgi:quercetin dioxygenase-like cupin family protein
VTEHFIPKETQHIAQKGWGHERWVVNNELYCGKLLVFNKGKCCSWHFHAVKDEVLLLHSGSLKVLYSTGNDIGEAQEVILQPGDAFHVPVGLRHRMVALEESEVYEFSTHHEDADSIRIQAGD